MEEKRYDFSFMKEYQELYEVSDLELARIFKCGIKKVQDVITGKILIKESVLEDILYDISFRSYDAYKEYIMNKINRKKEVLKLQEEKSKLIKDKPKIIKKEVKKQEEKIEYKPNIISILDLKNMTNKDILINVLLFGDVVNKDTKEISTFLNIEENYIINIYNNTNAKIKQKI